MSDETTKTVAEQIAEAFDQGYAQGHQHGKAEAGLTYRELVEAAINAHRYLRENDHELLGARKHANALAAALRKAKGGE